MEFNTIGRFPDDQEIVAIIGPRKPSSDSPHAEVLQHIRDCEVAYKLAQAAVKKGIAVLSGLASGIDTAAHLGSLDQGGITIAVVPFGLSAPVYPPENTPLFKKIISNKGCILSQFHAQQRVRKWTFVARDKTQAILSQKIIVVGTFPPNGIITGGTKHCAGWALKLGKPLYHYSEVDCQYRITWGHQVMIGK